jgi:hypothetical protein
MRPAHALLALSLALSCTGMLTAADTRSYVVVVNDANAKSTISTADLGRIFRKTLRRWDGGGSIDPVDLPVDSPVRAKFSQEILGRTPSQVQEYWLRETFSGREVPPVVRGTDAAILEYVHTNAGAIGYVSATASLPSGVKALKIAE